MNSWTTPLGLAQLMIRVWTSNYLADAPHSLEGISRKLQKMMCVPIHWDDAARNYSPLPCVVRAVPCCSPLSLEFAFRRGVDTAYDRSTG